MSAKSSVRIPLASLMSLKTLEILKSLTILKIVGWIRCEIRSERAEAMTETTTTTRSKTFHGTVK
jgi:hypothetical protein